MFSSSNIGLQINNHNPWPKILLKLQSCFCNSLCSSVGFKRLGLYSIVVFFSWLLYLYLGFFIRNMALKKKTIECQNCGFFLSFFAYNVVLLSRCFLYLSRPLTCIDFVYLSVYLFVCLCDRVSPCLSVFLSVCISLNLNHFFTVVCPVLLCISRGYFIILRALLSGCYGSCTPSTWWTPSSRSTWCRTTSPRHRTLSGTRAPYIYIY